MRGAPGRRFYARPGMRSFDVGFAVLRVLIGCWLLWRMPRPPGGGPRPPVTVVVPARDEARVIGRALASVTPQLGPDDELVVVDDDSSDGTGAVAADAGATVVVPPPRPDGWTGKTWACAAGAAAATNPVLAFLDADAQLEPGGLDRLVTTQTARGGMVSTYPYHDVPRPHEKLSAFFNTISLMGTDAFTPVGDRRRANGAFGPVIVVDRTDYDALDGHRSVAGEVLDDVKLAQRWAAGGRPVHLYGGRGTSRFRMYPFGLRDLVDGWTKNFAAGAGAARPATVVLISLWISLLVQSLCWPVRAALGHGDAPAAAGLYLVVALQVWWMVRRIGSFGPVTALLFPLPFVVFLAVFARSLVLTALGRPVAWKGRMVATGGRGRGGTPSDPP